MALDGIYNFVRIDARVATSGQPSKSQFESLAAEGYEAVINLAPYLPDNGAIADEAEFLAALGIHYRHVPVVWKCPTVGDFEQFCDAMESLSSKKMLIHCIANMRVSAFYSLYAMKHLGWTAAQADALLAPIWKMREEYAPGGVWRAFVDAMRQEITPRE
jgi:protein tyrosine phosphatase (PTP) superfamily phosphohydrolase (DUF442 family)